MKLLHLDSSILGDHSASRAISAGIVARWQHAVPGLEVLDRVDAPVVEELQRGRRAGGRCVIDARKGKRCTLIRRVGTLSDKSKAGFTTLKFPKALRKVSLKPGKYRVRVAVKNGPAAAPLRFRVVR